MRAPRRLIRAVLVASLFAATALTTATAPAPAAAGTNGLAATPYLGWSSWSLESTSNPGVVPNGEPWLTEQHVLQQADVLASKLKSHGYDYVNVDAGWSTGFDGYGRPLPDPQRFPDGMAHLGRQLHAKGLKFGLYLAVGLDPAAYGTGTTPVYGAPGCTTADLVYPDLRKTNGWNSNYKMDFGNTCSRRYLDSVADELAGWGVDFLKLDGVGPGSFQGGPNYDNTTDVAAWAGALQGSGRDIQFTISWALSHTRAATWQHYSNGWRVDTDVECYCSTLVTWNNSVKQRWNDVVQWIPDAGPGHWNNLDSLDVGNGAMDGITDTERQTYLTLWAIEDAPLYTGDDLTRLDSYGLSLLTNDEVIAVDQAGHPARPVSQRSDQQVWYARNADGSYTVGLFNLGPSAAPVTASFRDLGFTGTAGVRDLWSHTNLGTSRDAFPATVPAHGSRLLRVTPRGATAGPAVPTGLRGTGSTATSVSLAWDAAHGATGYDVYAGSRRVASTTGTSATASGLTAATPYDFTVVAKDHSGHSSPASSPVDVTTPAATGPVTYEAEASGNALAGSAAVYSCSGCSGGAKVGYLGGSGTLTVNGVTAPRAGTYLMTLSYVDGDTSRPAIVTVDGTPFNLPLSGTGDNDWGDPQTVVVPVQLAAGANTIAFGNPTDYVSDVDKVVI